MSPRALRRQLLLRVEPDSLEPRRVRVFPYTFKDPAKWRQLNRSPRLLSTLRASDIEVTEGCDLLLHQEGDQFRGGTTGLDCNDDSRGTELYVDYRTVIGGDVYWYRRRLLRESDDELVEEVMGYNWFEPNEARLFSCRVQWSATGKASDLRELARLDLHDQGGRARFATPDGRKFELTLHREDWPFASDRDALILLLEQPELTGARRLRVDGARSEPDFDRSRLDDDSLRPAGAGNERSCQLSVWAAEEVLQGEGDGLTRR